MKSDSRNFKSYKSAKAFRDAMVAQGYRAWIEEFYDYDGRFYSVLFWE